jgi:hypothetical protein
MRDVVLPYGWLSGSAEFAGQPQEREVSGFGDPRLRFSVNFYGAPALTLKEFTGYKQDLILLCGNEPPSHILPAVRVRWACCSLAVCWRGARDRTSCRRPTGMCRLRRTPLPTSPRPCAPTPWTCSMPRTGSPSPGTMGSWPNSGDLAGRGQGGQPAAHIR